MGDGALKNSLLHFIRWLAPKSIRKTVYDGDNNRVRLIGRAYWFADSSGAVQKSHEFYALEWDKKLDAKWKPFHVLEKKEFSRKFQHGAWVSDIESVDAETGCVVLEVAEFDVPRGGHQSVTYTIREWDLMRNREIKLIRVCDYPHSLSS